MGRKIFRRHKEERLTERERKRERGICLFILFYLFRRRK